MVLFFIEFLAKNPKPTATAKTNDKREWNKIELKVHFLRLIFPALNQFELILFGFYKQAVVSVT